MSENKLEFLQFSSIRDFMDVPVHKINERTWMLGLKQSRDMLYWYGSSTIEEVIRICREGWKEGLVIYEKLKKSLPEIEIVGEFHKKYKRKRKSSDFGDEIDIDKLIRKEFDTMYNNYNKIAVDKQGKIITIYNSIAFNSGRSSEESLWSGITSCILTDIFESVGYRVHLIGFISIKNLFISPPRFYVQTQINIDIKLPEKPLDLLNILMGCAYPGFFRYYGFKALESFPYEVHSSLGYGVPLPYIKKDNSFVISNIWDRDSSFSKIVEIVNQIKNRTLEDA